jgi:hypothetical protein
MLRCGPKDHELLVPGWPDLSLASRTAPTTVRVGDDPLGTELAHYNDCVTTQPRRLLIAPYVCDGRVRQKPAASIDALGRPVD